MQRAKRLFEFLARAQQLKNQPPRAVDGYRRDGAVLWLADLPNHPAVSTAHRDEDPEPDDPLLTIERVPRLDPPAPGETLGQWLPGPLDDPDHPPALRLITEPGAEPVEAPPEVRQHYDRWFELWTEWAAQDRIHRPVRAAYGELFSAYVTASGNPEELELVAGAGCLTWTPPGHPPVKRHLLTAPAAIHFDDDTGRLTVRRVESVDALDVELDMLDPGLVTNPAHVNEIRAEARQFESHPLHREGIGALARRLVHTLDANGAYQDTDEPPGSSPRAVAAFAPAIILRRRSQRGLVDIFQTIVDQLAETGEVPDGLLPLVDPRHSPKVTRDNADGALVMVDGDPFLPLPVNDVQLQILRQVDTKAQTLVQGPPGTGKTHTAAALLSHLLAQGKRVLVTAHTDRALREVREKLPAEIKPLSVAVVGTSREDMSDLKVAVGRIAAAAAEHDPVAARNTIADCLDTIERLRRERVALRQKLVHAREQEVEPREHAGYRGTLAAIAWQLKADAPRFGWLGELVSVSSGGEPPLSDAEVVEWHGQLLDAELAADEPESRLRLPDQGLLPEPAYFADLASAERAAARAEEEFATLERHPAFAALRRIDPEARGALQRRLRQLTAEADDLARRREPWMSTALADVLTGRAGIWQARARQIADLIQRSSALVSQLGPLVQVEVSGENVHALVPLANALYAHLNGGNAIRTGPGGVPKIGALAPKPVKQAQPVFDQVRVDGLPPATIGQLAAFLTWAEASKTLAALDRAWPENTPLSTEDPLHERLQWHVTELEQLHRVLRLADALEAEQRGLAEHGLPRPDWTDLDAVRTYAELVDAAGAADAAAAAEEPLRLLEETLAEAARWADAAPCVKAMLGAVRQRDHDEYADAHRRVERLVEVRRTAERRDQLAAHLAAVSPLRQAIERDPAAPQWNERLPGFARAWAWASTCSWVLEQPVIDVNAL
jgi:AAA domain